MKKLAAFLLAALILIFTSAGIFAEDNVSERIIYVNTYQNNRMESSERDYIFDVIKDLMEKNNTVQPLRGPTCCGNMILTTTLIYESHAALNGTGICIAVVKKYDETCINCYYTRTYSLNLPTCGQIHNT